VPERLVYSTHDYPWFHGRNSSAAALRGRWGRRWTSSDAPLLVGEFGIASDKWTNSATSEAAQWLRALRAYLDERGASWVYWAVNGTMSSAPSGRGRRFGAREPFGLLNTVWDAPANEHLARWLFS
jgi:hypothetical protein